MTYKGVILYGAPGVRKDATTTALTTVHPDFEHMRRIKIGTGRRHTYRDVTLEDLDKMRATPGAILWENEQYGGVYVADSAELDRLTAASKIPVLHLGQPEAIPAVRTATADMTWLAVELTCARDIAVQRIHARGTGDETRRLEVLDSTPPLEAADLRLDTGQLTPDDCAKRIAAELDRIGQ